MSSIDALSAVLRKQGRAVEDAQAEIASLKRALASNAPRGGGGLQVGGPNPRTLGAAWEYLTKLPWAKRNLVQAHAMDFQVELAGITDTGAAGGIPIDGVPVEAPDEVVAHNYFFVHTLIGRLERDLSNNDEWCAGMYVRWQLEDDSRNAQYGDENLPMAPLVGDTMYQKGAPLLFDAFPMAWYPKARIVATFSPMAGFTAYNPSVARQVVTRQAGITLFGFLVDKTIVDRLIEDNEDWLNSVNLIGRK